MSQEDDGPGNFAHVSNIYVWPSPEVNLGVHLVPNGFTETDLHLQMLTRASYHTLESIEDGVNTEGCFVMVHYIPSTQNIHVTMLSEGNPTYKKEIDQSLKEGNDGIVLLVERVKDLILGGSVANGVFIMFDHPNELEKGAIVCERNSTVSSPEMEAFLRAITPNTEDDDEDKAPAIVIDE